MQWIDIGANLTHDSFEPTASRSHRARARGRRGADDRDRCRSRRQPRGGAAGARACRRAVRDRRGASAPCCRAAGATICRVARVAAAPGSGRGRRMRSRLLPRFLAARRAAARLRMAARGWQLESGKPLFLHQRDAHADFLAILREHTSGQLRGVAHCFTGNGERARGLPRTRSLDRHHRLVLRRASRPRTSRRWWPHSGRAADARNRCALSAAARPEAADRPRAATSRCTCRTSAPPSPRRASRAPRTVRRIPARMRARCSACRRSGPSRRRNDAAIQLWAPCTAPQPTSACCSRPACCSHRPPPRRPRAPRLRSVRALRGQCGADAAGSAQPQRRARGGSHAAQPAHARRLEALLLPARRRHAVADAAPASGRSTALRLSNRLRGRRAAAAQAAHATHARSGLGGDPCVSGAMTATSTNLHFHGLTVPPVCHQDDVLRTSIQPNDPPFEYRFRIPSERTAGPVLVSPAYSRLQQAAGAGRRLRRADRRGYGARQSRRRGPARTRAGDPRSGSAQSERAAVEIRAGGAEDC